MYVLIGVYYNGMLGTMLIGDLDFHPRPQAVLYTDYIVVVYYCVANSQFFVYYYLGQLPTVIISRHLRVTDFSIMKYISLLIYFKCFKNLKRGFGL